jgi:hypothetical protein
MDKDVLFNIAEQVADDMGYDYITASPKMQAKIMDIAIDQYNDMMADKADMMRKNEADGGIMRAKYARGSEEDIPEQEDMPMEEFDDIKKMLGVPGEQASGIRSIDKRMVSAPDPMDERNQVMEAIAREEFGKPLRLLNEEEIMQIEEMLLEMSMKRRKPKSIKMAEYDPGNYDPLIVDEYEKYKFDAEEQGQPVMSIDEFLQMARSQAMNGGIMRNMYASGTPEKTYNPKGDYEGKTTLTYPKGSYSEKKLEDLIRKTNEEKKTKNTKGLSSILGR